MTSFLPIIIFIVILGIFALFLLTALASKKAREDFETEIENIISLSLNSLGRNGYVWKNLDNKAHLISSIRNEIVDQRKGGYSLKPSVQSRGPKKMNQLKNLVDYWVKQDLSEKNYFKAEISKAIIEYENNSDSYENNSDSYENNSDSYENKVMRQKNVHQTLSGEERKKYKKSRVVE
ncbi:hypothetical protein mflW37_5200 [Mesoplasma florum W37]|uniref:Uncharacterized protein n=1 Tax=Mesoplasma florum TaxID=2151 RepID=A0AAD0HTM5_MESFO|nr:hypothetical protein [Mesoplasma florum]AGY41587.1 hypothetical protein mflW37_5200 [Mesoplasma florum W37]AVN65925.1 hypothetical protein MflW12_5200 [Mesoplasma florum]